MELRQNVRDWLSWLARVRFLMITIFLAVLLVLPQYVQLVVPTRYCIPLIVLWYMLAFFTAILLQWIPKATWHAPMQMVLDLLMATALVYVTGTQESYFIPLYLLAIIVSSILFSPRGTFIVAGFSFILLGTLTELSFFEKIPRTWIYTPTLNSLRIWLFSNLFGFLAVGYLSSSLAQSLRRKGRELEEKSEELQDLQAFNEDIIHSMRGGLLTTDLEGRILLLNRTGEEITGYSFQELRGRSLPEMFPDFWLPAHQASGGGPVQRREIDFGTANGKQRYLGISVSPLRTRDRQRTGYVFSFQD